MQRLAPLGIIRLEMFSTSSVHIIGGLDDNEWTIASYHPYPEGNRMNWETRPLLLLHRADHYTLLEPAGSRTPQRDKLLRNFVSDFRQGCRTLHPEVEDFVVTEHFGNPTQVIQRVRGRCRA